MSGSELPSASGCTLPDFASITTAIADLARNASDIPDSADFQFYLNFPAFKTRVDSLRSRVTACLSKFSPPDLPNALGKAGSIVDVDEEEDELRDWLERLLDDRLDRVDYVLDDLRRKRLLARRSKTGAKDFGAAMADMAFSARKDRSNTSVNGIASTPRLADDLEVARKASGRPQDDFDPPVDNSEAPFRPFEWPFLKKLWTQAVDGDKGAGGGDGGVHDAGEKHPHAVRLDMWLHCKTLNCRAQQNAAG